MIVIKMVGGLASQLHKYAVVKSLAEKYNKEFKVDLSAYEKVEENDIMKYSLHNIGLNPLVASEQDIVKSKSPTVLGRTLLSTVKMVTPIPLIGKFSKKAFSSLGSRSLTKKFIYRNSLTIHVSDKSSLDWVEKAANSENCYIDAEFGLKFDIIQDIRDDLKQTITSIKISEHAQEYLEQIKSTPMPISMHVRRGDYVSNKAVNDFHGVCGRDYYIEALKKYSSTEQATVFVFSDDLKWVEEEFEEFLPKNTVFVSNNENYEDFSLMCNCSNHIIANSGFSSMSAWLSGANESNITSPARWFIHEETNRNQLEMLPKGWTYL